MFNASDKFKSSIIKANRELRSKVIVDDELIDSAGIISIIIEDAMLSDNNFKLGSAIYTKFEVVLNNVEGKFNDINFDGKEIQLYLGTIVGDNRFKINPDIEYIPMGIFRIDTPSKEKLTVTLSGYDKMNNFEANYISEIAYPATLLQIAQEIATKAGVELANTDFINSNYILLNKPLLDNITLRQAIGYVAELACGFAKINRNGKLEIRTLSDSYIQISGSNAYSFKNSESKYGSINKVVINSFGYTASRGVGNNTFTIQDNPFAQVPNELIEGIYNKLNGFEYMPFEATWQGNPCMDVGDKIIIIDKQNMSYNSIVTHNKFKYTNGLKSDTKATDVSKTIQAYSGNMTKQVLGLKERVSELQVNDDNIIARVALTEREIIGEGGLKERVDAAELKITPTSIVSTVRSSTEYNGDRQELASQITQTASEINQSVIDKANNLQGQITVQAGQISSKVSQNGVISSINQTSESITIQANKIGILGAVNIPTLSGDKIEYGTILGSNIKGSQIDIGANLNLKAPQFLWGNGAGEIRFFHNASNYTALRSDGVTGITTLGAKLTIGNLDASFINTPYTIYAGGAITSQGTITGNRLFTGGQLDFGAGFGASIYTSGYGIIGGNLTVGGTKSCMQHTDNFGEVSLQAYEMPSPYFGDIGEGIIKDGVCYVSIDDVLKECINTDLAYQVFTQVYSEDSITRIQRFKDYFVVYGTEGLEFAWEIKGKRRGYENNRFDKVEGLRKEGTPPTEDQRILDQQISSLNLYENINIPEIDYEAYIVDIEKELLNSIVYEEVI